MVNWYHILARHSRGNGDTVFQSNFLYFSFVSWPLVLLQCKVQPHSIIHDSDASFSQ
ncbi:hypothetical protein H112_04394 [Trichophyton rubrum D6]|uniref:Uncharacterized protein n=2 Tax=Trichophyton TaxID=5550 RepID=A0A022W2D6_TRIRU|nr:hypothetical protein H100_04403 [Trichophyton rubrum MR850]EZF41850.1 hypothetical protein H102_04387 [Trichophyton rubrum CBS 100081]EZF52522.1 hypothetical protein H103_04396 [Trichophyton rubrum CBS 288.86]EZF63012.1 hypothetical protein H104_04385 [Trichophyton rubrum CBS 289.86]EZF73763.1 hypothetical protein H105_04411 [Trichophyton soudanense CBS 452.61]EZF84434.1 hypothetical protein H110_04389 [Trichophyton rubrum MR1448]EZF95112.1 hypothetical protein H113_04430 [Trichophyton rub